MRYQQKFVFTCVFVLMFNAGFIAMYVHFDTFCPEEEQSIYPMGESLPWWMVILGSLAAPNREREKKPRKLKTGR